MTIKRSVSQHRALKRHAAESCGFESCEYYVTRSMHVDVDSPVTWPAGAPEDDIVFKIDWFERQIRSLNRDCPVGYSEWKALYGERARAIELLRSELKTRLEKTRGYCLRLLEMK